jgi:hypothetical protein
MDKVLHATYHDGNLVLDEKLDTALEGRKFTLILVEDAAMASQDETDVADRKRNFFEKLQNYSVKLPEDYKFDREEIHDRECFHRL